MESIRINENPSVFNFDTRTPVKTPSKSPMAREQGSPLASEVSDILMRIKQRKGTTPRPQDKENRDETPELRETKPFTNSNSKFPSLTPSRKIIAQEKKIQEKENLSIETDHQIVKKSFYFPEKTKDLARNLEFSQSEIFESENFKRNKKMLSNRPSFKESIIEEQSFHELDVENFEFAWQKDHSANFQKNSSNSDERCPQRNFQTEQSVIEKIEKEDDIWNDSEVSRISNIFTRNHIRPSRHNAHFDTTRDKSMGRDMKSSRMNFQREEKNGQFDEILKKFETKRNTVHRMKSETRDMKTLLLSELHCEYTQPVLYEESCRNENSSLFTPNKTEDQHLSKFDAIFSRVSNSESSNKLNPNKFRSFLDKKFTSPSTGINGLAREKSPGEMDKLSMFKSQFEMKAKSFNSNKKPSYCEELKFPEFEEASQTSTFLTSFSDKNKRKRPNFRCSRF